jgi:hypothetical protein
LKFAKKINLMLNPFVRDDKEHFPSLDHLWDDEYAMEHEHGKKSKKPWQKKAKKKQKKKRQADAFFSPDASLDLSLERYRHANVLSQTPVTKFTEQLRRLNECGELRHQQDVADDLEQSNRFFENETALNALRTPIRAATIHRPLYVLSSDDELLDDDDDDDDDDQDHVPLRAIVCSDSIRLTSPGGTHSSVSYGDSSIAAVDDDDCGGIAFAKPAPRRQRRRRKVKKATPAVPPPLLMFSPIGGDCSSMISPRDRQLTTAVSDDASMLLFSPIGAAAMSTPLGKQQQSHPVDLMFSPF